MQQEAIRAYCRANGLTGTGFKDGSPSQLEPLWYIDPATSGKTLLREREAGSVLCQSLRKGDHIVLAKLDRAFRRLSDCCVMLEEFERRGINFHICNLLGGALNLSTPIGRFVIQMLGAFAELERAFIAERTSEAMKARKRRGEGGGRPHYGFKHDVRHRTVDGKRVSFKVEVPDPDERKIMKMCLAWRTEDTPWSWEQIREKLIDLRIRTRDGQLWGCARIKRACRAEAILQFKEVTDGRCHEHSR